MNKNQYWLIIATTTINVQPKHTLDAKLKAFGLRAPKYSLISIMEDAVGEDEDKKVEAIAKLNDPEAFFYMNNNTDEYKKIAAKMKKLRAKDFLKVHGSLNAVARVAFYFNEDGAEFNISWVLDRKEAERLNALENGEDVPSQQSEEYDDINPQDLDIEEEESPEESEPEDNA